MLCTGIFQGGWQSGFLVHFSVLCRTVANKGHAALQKIGHATGPVSEPLIALRGHTPNLQS